MKRTLVMILAVCLVLCGCASQGGGGRQIRQEVISAYNMNSEMQEQVEKLFADCDQAFKELEEIKAPMSTDVYNYAKTISDLLSDFYDAFNWETVKEKMNNASSEEEKSSFATVLLESNDVISCKSELNMQLFNMMMGMGSGESCLEAAVEAINGYAQFFYGEAHITEEDLDRIGVK